MPQNLILNEIFLFKNELNIIISNFYVLIFHIIYFLVLYV